MEAQMRMKNAKVLVVNFTGIAVEICKNLVLSGIGQVDIADHASASAMDLASNFFLTDEDLGKSRVQAALPRVQQLNPLVRVSHVSADLALSGAYDLHTSFYTCNRTAALQASAHLLAIPLALLQTRNPYLGGSYTYANKEGARWTMHNYIPLSAVHAAEYSWNAARPSPACVAVQAALQAGASKDKSPAEEEIISAIQSLSAKHSFSTPADTTSVVSALAAAPAGACFSPVCAVLGGEAAQEIIKVISMNFAPHHNLFVYDAAVSFSGTVESFEPPSGVFGRDPARAANTGASPVGGCCP
eukprot:gene12195-334_t